MPLRVGRHSAAVRRLRTLRRDARARRDTGVLLAEGPRLVREALDAGASIESALASPRLLALEDGAELLERLERAGAEVLEAADDVVSSIQDAHSPQPITAVVLRPRHDVAALLERATAAPLVVVAAGIQDPGNLGGLIRTAAAAGSTAFLACGDAADLYHPRAVRASAGAVFRVPHAQLETDAAVRLARAAGLVLLGADPRGGRDYGEVDFDRRVALCFGSEGGGFEPRLAESFAGTIRVPMRRDIESLSVGAAAAIVLFEALRRRAR